jgi:regulator of protease activity HflC (stomatin/prohibitin superfamily)
MERNIQKNGLVNLLVLLAVGVAGFAVARLTQSLAGQLSTIFLGIGALVAAVSWFQMGLEERERLEKLEFDELAKSKGGSALFEAKDSEAFPAQRSREQFERFFVPGFTALLFLAEAVLAWLLWRGLAKSDNVIEVKQPTVALALFGLFALVLFLLGKFSATIARLENHRLLRPGASWLLLGAYLCFVVSLGVVGVEAGFPKADFYVTGVLCGLLGLIAVETLIQLILEIYRPRVKGKIARPLYDSRLVGLLGQPEGLITTAAQALDYQFGFKVSETWFYKFFISAIEWVVLLQLAVLLLSTMFVIIEPGERGLLERFGKPVAGRTLLDPGAHFKWPWPVDKVYRYHTEQIQSFNVGFTPDPKFDNQNIVLWTVPHTKEENFLVANHEQNALQTTNDTPGKRTPPVSLLTVSIPVQFQITNLLAWAYTNDAPANLLQNVATREVVRYFVSVDLNDVMSQGRFGAAEALRTRIQAAADERKLGAKIVFVGLQDIHPPVKVAPDYEKVVSANQTRQAKILAAQADAIRTNAFAGADAFKIVNDAEANRRQTEVGAWARAAMFTNQIPAFEAAPSVYLERAYLRTFASATAGARKYVLLTTNTEDVFQFDLQDKIRTDLLEGLNPTPAKK